MAALKVAHLITGLATGGAEQMLYKLLSANDTERCHPLVISMVDRGTLGDAIERLGVPVYCLGMRRGAVEPHSLWRLCRILRRERPDLLQTWLYHADLLGFFGAKLASVPHVVWNLRCSNMDLGSYSRLTRLVARTGTWLSRYPDAVVANSHAGQRFHESQGYRPRRWKVIPNGFDLSQFAPNPQARCQVRAELELPRDAFLIGLVARFDPMKDHETFLRAAQVLVQRQVEASFVMVGAGVDPGNPTLRRLVTELGLGERVRLLGERRDVARITAALDIASSSSRGEGFSNVIGEAMASGIPCVVTDVGDSASIVDGTGRIVPPGQADALAEAWIDLERIGPDERRRLGADARRRVQENFSLASVAAAYQDLYNQIVRIGET